MTVPLTAALLVGAAAPLAHAQPDPAARPDPTTTATSGAGGAAPSRQAHGGRPAGQGQAPGLAAATAAADAPPPDGTFVRYEGRTFRMVGGATLYLASWAPFGGPQPSVALTKGQWLATNQYPADGTFVQTAQTHAVYRFVAGAPLYVSTFRAFRTPPRSVVAIDRVVLDHAGGNFPYDSVASAPLDWDGTNGGDPVFVQGGQTGRVYKLTGGAPTHVSQWRNFGGPKPVTVVDQKAIDLAGGTGHWRYLRRYPMDGWTVRAAPSGEIYVLAGGAPLYVSTTALLDGLRPAAIDAATVARTRLSDPPYGNLRHRPADGTFLRTVQGGRVYRMQDGHPVYVSSWTPYGGIQPYVDIDEAAVQHAGEDGVWNHLGTVRS
jgi:hypothetical protein